jgi:hypothetical protein
LPETTSIANLANEEWTITNTTHDVVTVDLWLDVALDRHRAKLGTVTAELVTVRYQLDGVDIDGDVCAVRSVLDWLREAYRIAKTYDVTTRPERYALLERLAESRVMPSEMAVMVGVDVSIAERFAGADDEARIARSILDRLKPVERREQ